MCIKQPTFRITHTYAMKTYLLRMCSNLTFILKLIICESYSSVTKPEIIRFCFMDYNLSTSYSTENT